MKSFDHWVNDLANSIEDKSIIKKDEKGVIIPDSPTCIICKNCGANALKEIIYEDMYYYD